MAIENHSEIPHDVHVRIEHDFRQNLVELVCTRLLEKIPDNLPNGTLERHLRCVVYLAKGDFAKLNSAIELCLQDTRDVMMAAEYETDEAGNLVRKRNFMLPMDAPENTEPPGI